MRHPLTGAVVSPAPRPLKEVEIGNEIRRVALPVLAQLQLGSPEAAVRLAAAEELSKSGSAEAATLLHRALAREKDAGVREALELAVARVDLAGTETAARIAALDVIGKSGNDGFLSELQRLTAKGADGKPVETDPDVLAAAVSARPRPSRATSAWWPSAAACFTACRWRACCCSRRWGWRSPSACWASSTWPTARC